MKAFTKASNYQKEKHQTQLFAALPTLEHEIEVTCKRKLNNLA